ncbi:MAG: bifunctional DNA-formamidopyrimidine glycosylase/DNA-(apurinic or apyrimidinic site) lyase [Thermoleophilaceae bacterium]|nr:bifunctional DNA-formamidopyrimidine glycosylase/DNA-(apurinic or apyrimidinic site) lyase [Thermoleophilaceae bacterium]
MPELPEVETIRRQLAPLVTGRIIEQVDVLDPRLCAPLAASTFARRLIGCEVVRFDRRGKFMLLALDKGSILVMHLRMTGNLLYLPPDHPVPEGHLRATMVLSDEGQLAFVDARRFGTAAIYENQAALDQYFAGRVGVEPFGEDFTPQYLYERARNRRSPIKAFLLDQKHVAGVGNIYADEALFRAGIKPTMPASKLSRARAQLLHESIVDALTAGIDAKGATIDDFRDAYGVMGSFQDQFLVHRRERLPCPTCSTPVTKTRVAGRGTYFCSKCQRA